MLIRSVISAAILMVHSMGSAQAQDYPTRPVQLIVGWSAGASVDATARGFAKSMAEVSGGQFVVVNREGAAGVIGAQQVAQATPDGYTLGYGPITPMAAVAYATKNPRFTVNDFQFVCKVFDNVLTVMVPTDSPYKSLQELIAAVRTQPGKMAYGHFGLNSLGHMVGAKLVDGLGLDVTEVPFKGEAPIYQELMANRLDFALGTLAGGRGKSVRLLGVISEARVASAPDVPTLKELGLPTMAPAQVGLFVPRNTPQTVLTKLDDLCQKTVKSASFQAHMTRLQEPVNYRNRADFTKLVQEATQAQIEQARKMGIQPQ